MLPRENGCWFTIDNDIYDVFALGTPGAEYPKVSVLSRLQGPVLQCQLGLTRDENHLKVPYFLIEVCLLNCILQLL